MFTDPSALAVAPRTPLAALIEAEAEGPPDALDLAGIRGIPLDALAVLLRFLPPDGRSYFLRPIFSSHADYLVQSQKKDS